MNLFSITAQYRADLAVPGRSALVASGILAVAAALANIVLPDGRTLNPGHAIECAWFIMHEGRHRGEARLAAEVALAEFNGEAIPGMAITRAMQILTVMAHG